MAIQNLKFILWAFKTLRDIYEIRKFEPKLKGLFKSLNLFIRSQVDLLEVI